MAKNKNNEQTTPTNISQECIQYLGLSKQPFMSEILSDKGFFKIPSLEKITENLIHQVQFSELLLIVEGLQGSGKTSLFRQLIQSEIPNIKLLSIQAEATDTLVQIQQKISLHMQDLGDANHLEDNLKSLQMFDQTPLIIMDNSHVLSDTTIQELFRYQQQLKDEHDVTLKILLFANVGMTETLQNITDIPPEHMYVQHIPEYTAKQSSEFIMQRLANAGYNGEPLFNEHDFELLLKKSIATPINLMKYAAPALDKIIKNKTSPAGGGLKKILLPVLIIAILGVAGLGYFYFTQQEQTVDANQAEPEAAEIFVPDPGEEHELDSGEEVQQLSTAPPDELPSDSMDEGLQSPEPGQEPVLAEQPVEADTAPLILETTPDEITASEEPEILPTEDTPVETIAPPIQESLAESTEKPSSETITPAQPAPAISTQPQLKPSVRLHPALKQLSAMGVQDSTWINQQSTSDWTKQLIGAREPATLLKFVRKHPLGAQLAWYKTRLKGKPYYVLIHGSYPGRDIARASIAKLPSQLQAMKPWVKSMKSVQMAIK